MQKIKKKTLQITTGVKEGTMSASSSSGGDRTEVIAHVEPDHILHTSAPPASPPPKQADSWDMVEVYLSFVIVVLFASLVLLGLQRYRIGRPSLQPEASGVNTPAGGNDRRRRNQLSSAAPGPTVRDTSWNAPPARVNASSSATRGNPSAVLGGHLNLVDHLECARVAEIKKLPRYRWAGGGAHGDECVLCIEPYVNGDTLRLLPCNHYYHQCCIDQWLIVGQHNSHHRACPLCKADPIPQVAKIATTAVTAATAVATTAAAGEPPPLGRPSSLPELAQLPSASDAPSPRPPPPPPTARDHHPDEPASATPAGSRRAAASPARTPSSHGLPAIVSTSLRSAADAVASSVFGSAGRVAPRLRPSVQLTESRAAADDEARSVAWPSLPMSPAVSLAATDPPSASAAQGSPPTVVVDIPRA